MATPRSPEGIAAPGAGEFNWPAPPHYEFAESDTGPGTDACRLDLKDGRTLRGRLVNFVPDRRLLTFQLGEHATGQSISFARLLRLQMVKPLRATLEGRPPPAADAEFAPTECQPFSVKMTNGEEFRGITVGHVSALSGLFLFLPHERCGVVRCFVPAETMRACSFDAEKGPNPTDTQTGIARIASVVELHSPARAQKPGIGTIGSMYELVAALKRQRARPVRGLGEALLDLGILTPAQLDRVLQDLDIAQKPAHGAKSDERNRSIRFVQSLLDKRIVDAALVNRVMAAELEIPTVELHRFSVAPEILDKIPAEMAERLEILPLHEAEGTLVVAIENPFDVPALDEVRLVTGMAIVPVIAPAAEIKTALESHYRSARSAHRLTSPWRRRESDVMPGASVQSGFGIEELASRLAAESGDLELNEQQAAQSNTTLVKLVNKIIMDAVEQGASDIHIEANADLSGMRVRFRKDGTLIVYTQLPSKFRRAVVSRIKIMSQLDITERRKPQDGKIEFSRFAPVQAELRVATIPTANGLEDVVMRVLVTAKPVSIEQLGFDALVLESTRRLISKPNGLFLVCGPTGSGKTTTLHSLLAFLNTDERKIWTAEDPIEIVQPGLRQVQVHAKIGLSFAAAMRSFLRADPDVIMVGEMRDAETTKMAIEASLTGHLVLSTLHTNSAPESIARLLDLGLDPFNFADALLGVLAQRLTKQLCPACKLAYMSTEQESNELRAEYSEELANDDGRKLDSWHDGQLGQAGAFTLYRARGCERCDRTGYHGRVALHELLVTDSVIKRLVQTKAPVEQLKEAGAKAGMLTLKQDGIRKILKGLTDIRQVRAVCS